MILVLILSAANQEWLSAVFHLAVLALLQLVAVWAKRRWAASRAAQAQNDPAKLVQYGGQPILICSRQYEDEDHGQATPQISIEI